MNRIISAKNYYDFVLVAYFENDELKLFEYIYTPSSEKFTRLKESIDYFTRKYKIKLYKLSFNMDDSECILHKATMKHSEVGNYIDNIRYQFPGIINPDETFDYVFDYQTVKNKKTTDVYTVAASKAIIEEYIELAISLNKRLDVLRPETSSIGAVLKVYDLMDTIVVDVGSLETVVRVYDAGKISATSITSEGIKEGRDILLTKTNSEQELEEYKKQIGRISTSIIKTISYYDENKITKKSHNVMITGEGTTAKDIEKTISGLCTHQIICPKDYIRGTKNIFEAPALFSMTGLLY